MIAVDGDEKVDSENTELHKKATHFKLKQFCKMHVGRHNLLYL